MPGLTFHFHRPNYLASYTFIPGLRQGIKEMTFGVGITRHARTTVASRGTAGDRVQRTRRYGTAIVPMQCEAS